MWHLHDRGHLARHAFRFAYDPQAAHPRLDCFFSEVFADAHPFDAQQRTHLIQEYAGTSLIGEATRHQKMLVFEGSGANGKSSALDILSGVFPPGSVSSLAPHDWGSKFRTAALAGKLINVVNELPEGELVTSAVLKSVISGEPIMAENKLEKPFSFRPVAGHVFAANSLPATSDHTQGFWRRLLVVPFTRDMMLSPGRRQNVAAEILAAELPGIVLWALEGAARVQRQGGYTKCAASDSAIDRWRQEIDPVLTFIRSECVVSPMEWTSSRTLYTQYDKWVAENGFGRMSSGKFFRRLSALNLKAQHGRNGNGYPVRVICHRP